MAIGRAACLSTLDKAEVPCGRIYTVQDIVQDPHHLARQMIETATLPDGTTARMPGITPKLSETPGSVRWIGRELGADTAEILEELGFAPKDIQRFQSNGFI